ncbi:hypothetical protein PQR52_06735 [Paraburkholderia aspalathi]|uniref:hypothetical protein n=1 Tax=Paraburkholderia aspalathi TaxID=1324617 RepID=UPI0038BD9677
MLGFLENRGQKLRRMWKWTEIAFGLVAALLVGFAASALARAAWGWNSGDVASWVQAIGSIAAIFGAAWIAGEQHRRDVSRRKVDEEKANYLLAAELAWLSGDILGILNMFVNAKPGIVDLVAIPDDEVSDLLTRLTWCRQRVVHKGQLAMIGTLRHSLVETVRIVQTRGQQHPASLTDEDIDILDKLREAAREAYNCAMGVSHMPRYAG